MNETSTAEESTRKAALKGLGLALAIIAVIAAVPLILFLTGTYLYLLPPVMRIAWAAQHTFVEDEFLQDTHDLTKVLGGNTFTLSVDTSATLLSTDVSRSITYAQNRKEDVQSINGSVSVLGLGIPFTEYLDREELIFSIPSLSSRLLVYPYGKEPGEALVQILGEENIDRLNADLEILRDAIAATPDTSMEELGEMMHQAATSMHFKKAGTERGRVGKQRVTAVLYQTSLDAKEREQAIEALQGALFGGEIQLFSGQGTFGELLPVEGPAAAAKALTQFIDETVSAGDGTLTLGVWNDRFTSIAIKDQSNTLRLVFSGKELPWQSLSCTMNGEELFSLDAQRQDDKDLVYTLTTPGKEGEEEQDSLTYEPENRYVTVDLGSASLQGSLVKDEKDTWSFSGTRDGDDLSVTLKKGAGIVRPSGEELDLSQASLQDLTDSAGILGKVLTMLF